LRSAIGWCASDRAIAAFALVGAVFAVTLSAAAPRASAQVQPYGKNDARGFTNVLPPGTNGLVNLAQLGAFLGTKGRPPHNDDQLAMYSNLTTAAPSIHPSQIGNFFKDATFGVPRGQVGSTESPEPGVTIVRDKRYGVPHVYGDTRAALEFGIGYATAEDRLFFIDALRHAGQGDLAQFAGGANVAMDESVWASEPYTQQDLVNQIHFGVTHSAAGPQILRDATNYVNGINAYIAKAKNPLFTPTLMPAEYAALGMPLGPKPFTLEDLVSIATLVGGIFGNGGGDQLANAVLYEQLKRRFGAERSRVAGSPEPLRPPQARAASRKAKAPVDHSGFATFLSFADPADPEAPSTVHGHTFPYQTLPPATRAKRPALALPDPGSVRYVNHVVAGAPPANGPRATSSARRHAGLGLGPSANAGSGLLAFPRDMSNALLVSAAHSASGHPIAVMGPQVSYFTPQILMEEDIHGPGIDADGAAFPGVNLYVELGHGRDYAWSATSSGQNIIDTFAVPLCNPGGGKASTGSEHYLLHGRCVRMETLTRTESWQPNPADSTPKGSITLQTQRTAYGIVIARATIRGRAVAYCNLRSTYMHELDSAVAFERFNEPAAMRNPQDFFNAANQVGYTFNWFYTDDKHIAYFNSGLNPVRAPGTNPLFPSWASFAWRGYHPAALTTPSSLTEDHTPQSAHPHVIDQEYLTSWNNKQAPGYNDAATGQQYSSIYRSQLLDNNINHYLSGERHTLSLTDLINAMGNAGTQDLRGVEVLPYALQILGHPRDRTLATAVSELRTWVATGAHRINREHPGPSGNYDQTDAVRIMDAWWPLLVKAQFQPLLGESVLARIEGEFPINDEPGHGTSGAHLGSAWDVGFYGIVQKDLRAALHQHVAGPLNRVYCGGGSLAACRSALQSSLRQAIAESPHRVYPADGVCQAGDQMCSDSIQFRAIGAVTQPLIEWVNRPTFQQADQIMGHGPR
jgi:acyl-homoserine lactone acylase PvdQ